MAINGLRTPALHAIFHTMLTSSMIERLDLLISQYPKTEDGTLEEDDKWSLDVCGDGQDLEDRKAAFNHQGVFTDCKVLKDRQEGQLGIASGQEHG